MICRSTCMCSQVIVLWVADTLFDGDGAAGSSVIHHNGALAPATAFSHAASSSKPTMGIARFPCKSPGPGACSTFAFFLRCRKVRLWRRGAWI